MKLIVLILLLSFLGLQTFAEARPAAEESILEAVNVVKRQSDRDWDSPRGGGSYGGRGSDGDWDSWYYAKNPQQNDNSWWA